MTLFRLDLNSIQFLRNLKIKNKVTMCEIIMFEWDKNQMNRRGSKRITIRISLKNGYKCLF